MPITSLALSLLAITPGVAGEPIDRLEVSPPLLRLREATGAGQVVVTGRDASGRALDLTASARFAVDDQAVAAIDPGGLARPGKAGATTVAIEAGGRSASLVVRVDPARPVGFEGEVEPTLSKLDCNAGACHGKAGGQGGFRLCLLGYDPRADHEAIGRESSARRVSPAVGDESLLLLKPTGRIPHGGGVRFVAGSPEYGTLARWVAEGSRLVDGPVLDRLEVEPGRRILPRGGRQQVRVTATYRDGSIVDVTRLARFDSLAGDLASVGPTGLIIAGEGVGEAAILARFGGLVALARAVIPLPGGPTDWVEPASTNPIDRLVFTRLRDLGLDPSGPCTDAEFARRSSLDLCGVLPDPAEVAAFEADADPGKRARRVDALLERPESADLAAMTWSAILKNRRALGEVSRPETFAFHDWVRQAIAENMPYDRFVAAILAARGDPEEDPAAPWTRRFETPEARADDAAQLFLGLRIGCARCHHHPVERWSQDDYYGFASLFARVGAKGDDPASAPITLLPAGLATNPATGRGVSPRVLGGPEIGGLGPGDDPRDRLVAWLRLPENPRLARALAHRTWKRLMGRGFVEPEDDIRDGNPPTNPDLLDALAASFVRSGYDARALARLIATSRA